MAFSYLSPEWIEEGRRRIATSEEFREAAKGLTASLLNVITDAPNGSTLYLYYQFVEGRITELVVGDESLTKRPAEFTATGKYETFVAVNQGKLTSTGAVFQRKIKLEGNLAKALRYVKPIEVFNKVVRTVPTVY